MSNLAGLRYLESLQSWTGKGGFDLSSMQSFCAALENPQDSVRSVHVAGTNGKGSVSAAVASIAGAAGLRVGLISSPHLSSQCERVIIDGHPISEHQLSDVMLYIMDTAGRLGLKPSYFEAITLAGFVLFAQAGLDLAVVEVGLGGRLDATNVIARPDVAVICNIDRDHEEILGPTLVDIAREKGGIIKPGSKVVLGNIYSEARAQLMSMADRLGTPVWGFGDEFEVLQRPQEEYFLRTRSGEEVLLHPRLRGEHQIHNMAVAAMVGLLLGFSAKECMCGVADVFWPGRIEELRVGERRIVLDAAHNVPGMRALSEYLSKEGLVGIEAAFGVLTTKHWEAMIGELAPMVGDWNLLEPLSPMALSAANIASCLSRNGISNVRSYGNDYERFLNERVFSTSANCAIPLVVTGSLYLLGEIRRRLVSEQVPLWRRKA